ncbi:site-2 protease family protein [Fictibacillus aquaticus]|uniref:Peptidase M50 domain-containing protein n=1 Tax=Fictibacillus aquaticus TaxID=2021314 RepID=A0A235F808_9BACL|nr:site-2 protease family protein [Fictibacillus aquaticus]OYD57481.1 hypothetical protein CGZ90_12450 [Fictibacillus aquaticus]
MFGVADVIKFLFSFLLVAPLVTLTHEFGHMIAGRLTGSKVDIHIGAGNLLVKLGPCKIRKVYFWDGWCEYKNLNCDKKWRQVVVYLGGPTLNLLSILVVNTLMIYNVFEPDIFFYQFMYFSFYFIFFSVIPIEHNGLPTDGKAALDVIRFGQAEKNPYG